MTETQRRLIPQFTLRGILIAITGFAVVSFFLAQGQRGRAWSAGVSIGALAMVVTFATFALMFIVARAVAGFVSTRNLNSAANEAKPPLPPSLDRVAKTVLWAFVVSVSFPAQALWAASGGIVVLPAATNVTGPMPGTPPKNKSGLTLSIDTTWIDSSGYRPVRVTVASTTGPLVADRTLTLRFHWKSMFTTRDSVVVTETVEIPAGAASATATISVPQFAPSGSFEFDTFEDGQYLKELSIPSQTGWTSWSGTFQADSVSPVILMLSGPSAFNQTAMSRNGVPPELLFVLGGAGFTPGSALPGTGASLAAFSQLPTRWIDYTGFDIAIVSLDDAKTLRDKHPEQWRAIRNWQRNGGNLLVYGVGSHWEELSELEKLLDISTPNKADSKAADDMTQRGWQLPLKRNKTNLLLAAGYLPNTLEGAPTDAPAEAAADTAETETDASKATPLSGLSDETIPAESAKFVSRKDGLGTVVAVVSGAYISGGNFDWNWILNTIGPQRWQWFQRNGVSFYRPNEDFWNFLIPGVGLAPVTGFQVLITLFVVSIGPVNYWYLKRRGKLNLLVLTVPISAFFITGALVAYALVSDGLSIRARARSITQIDQSSGETTCWTRLSYYAGLAPGNGLEFSDDTAVYPLESAPQAGDATQTRDLTWAQSDPSNSKSPVLQKLTDGWLFSRTPTQFITSRVRKTKSELEINFNKSGGPQITNRLGAILHQVVVADETGKLFAARDVGNGDSAQLDGTKNTVDALLREMSATLSENAPQMPDTMSGRANRGYFGLNNNRRNTFNRWQNNPSPGGEPEPNQSLGILEQSISSVRDRLQAGKLSPRSYIAITDRSPEVQLGTPAANEEASLHVIVGRW